MKNETLRYALKGSGRPWGEGERTKARLNPLLNRDECLLHDHIDYVTDTRTYRGYTLSQLLPPQDLGPLGSINC